MSCITSAVVIDDRINQLSLDGFIPHLKKISQPDPSQSSAFQQDSKNGAWLLPLKIDIGNVIVLQDVHCPRCASALIKNGRNMKKDYCPGDQISTVYWLQRYICPRCGEIRIDHHAIFAGDGKYGEELPKI